MQGYEHQFGSELSVVRTSPPLSEHLRVRRDLTAFLSSATICRRGKNPEMSKPRAPLQEGEGEGEGGGAKGIRDRIHGELSKISQMMISADIVISLLYERLKFVREIPTNHFQHKYNITRVVCAHV